MRYCCFSYSEVILVSCLLCASLVATREPARISLLHVLNVEPTRLSVSASRIYLRHSTCGLRLMGSDLWPELLPRSHIKVLVAKAYFPASFAKAKSTQLTGLSYNSLSVPRLLHLNIELGHNCG